MVTNLDGPWWPTAKRKSFGMGDYWSMNDMLDFVQAARGQGLTVSMSRGDMLISVHTTNSSLSCFVRFWWSGRVDCLSGIAPDMKSPEWLDGGDPSAWYEYLGMERPRE